MGVTLDGGITPDELAAVPDASTRLDPVEILQAQARSRVQELVPVRYGRMVATPFTFFRGAAAVMAADLASTPDSGIHTQLCGDAHLSNFGLFYTPERRMAFDLNDFDETHPGPFEWDVKRLAASVAVAARGNGFAEEDVRRVTREVGRVYRKSMRRSRKKSTLECWYDHIDVDEDLVRISAKLDTSTAARTRKALTKARHRDSVQALSKLCETAPDGSIRIRSDPPLLVPLREIFSGEAEGVAGAEIDRRLGDYRSVLAPHVAALFDQFTMIEVARKVVGVGSVGTRAWIVLLRGRDLDDPLFLQLKEAQESVLAPYVRGHVYANQGARVVEGQRLMQAASDIFLGWHTGVDDALAQHDFYVRQLRDGKGSVVIEALEPQQMRLYARLCGRVLAQAHARTAGRERIVEFVDVGSVFDEAIAEFAVRYADLNDADHAQLRVAVDSGRVPCRELV
ncbi:DUF2252 domain-containing protein [Gordonia soli]|uniref:DUF2252 domain-containing protein n=1 Tax=Gordonia soli NBRC 108243 TaxID=1223545 RepID=M0QH55_9ACTN|nr:DUF2252 domain-containing protein [Gordonia soli]GAC67651.1 hypothetical protein GS4_08_02360 [Gordonia soli NBRC 108243]